MIGPPSQRFLLEPCCCNEPVSSEPLFQRRRRQKPYENAHRDLVGCFQVRTWHDVICDQRYRAEGSPLEPHGIASHAPELCVRAAESAAQQNRHNFIVWMIVLLATM